MCGIIGFSSKKVTKKQIDILYNLIIQSKIRGLHAFGIAYYKNGKIVTKKSFELPKKTFLDDFSKYGSGILIAHNRYTTSGDYKNMVNNQPITINSDISVAINGVLSMKPKKEYEQEFYIKCITENDAEIFAQKLKEGLNPETIIRQPIGSCAAIYLFYNRIYAIRNNTRPLHWFKEAGAIFVCSTVDIVDRALNKKINVYNVESYKLLTLNDKI